MAALVGSGCSAAAQPRGAAATVKDSSISNNAFTRELNVLRENKKLAAAVKAQGASLSSGPRVVSSSIGASWLGQLVIQKIVDRKFAARGKRLTAAQLRSGKALAESSLGGAAVFAAFPAWFRTLETTRKARTLAVTTVSAADRAAIFEKQYAANASQCPDILLIIQVADASSANAVISEINAGTDFQAVARRDSLETQTGSEGGVAGCANNSNIPAELTAAVAGLKPGEPSKPVTVSGATYVATTKPYGPAVLAREIEIAAQRQALIAIQKPYKGDVSVNPRYGTVAFGPTSGFVVSAPKGTDTNDQPGGSVPTATTAQAAPGSTGTTAPAG